MSTDPRSPVRLLSAKSEVEAAIIVAALDACGIEARATGGYASEFRAEIPGEVQVLVRQADLENARQALEEIRAISEVDAVDSPEGETAVEPDLDK